MKTEAMNPRRAPPPISRASQGFSLVEMMVAMTIGLVLVGAGIAVYANSRAAYTVNESISRLQENARYALEEITKDLRLAGYWGENSSAALVLGALPNANNDCAPQWYTNLSNRVQGSDGVNTTYTSCIPVATYQAGTDILAMRFVDPTPVVTLVADTPYLRSNRNIGRLFLGAAQPSGMTDAQDYKLQSRAYYVSPWTNTLGDGAPALKRVVLVPGAGNVAMEEEVVVSGVENLQVQYQYALDLDNDGRVDDVDKDGIADRYVNGGAGYVNGVAGVSSWSQVEAVRIWLLVRAPTEEAGYTNTSTFRLPPADVTPNDRFRRVLVTKTIHLHN